MKKLLLLLALAVVLLPAAAFADSLPLAEDLAETVTVFYNGADDSSGRYEYAYRYPHADPDDPTAFRVNSYYEYLVQDTKDNTIPNLADYYSGMGESVTVRISYEITCNNNDLFSVRIHFTEENDEEFIESWSGNTFSRTDGMPGSLYSLPNLLGILSSGESDEWLEERQAGKACDAVLMMVWDRIRENSEGIEYYPDLDRKTLEAYFDPELDFWLDESGNPVFFLLPGRIAPEEAGLLTFPVSLEDIKDEL